MTVHSHFGPICRAAVPVVATLVLACSDNPTAIRTSPLPVVEGVSIAPNPHNVLSAVVTARVGAADSCVVHFRRADQSDEDNVTVAVPVNADSIVIPVLGLLPGQRYAMRVVAYGPGGNTSGSALEFTTGFVPGDLPSYTAAGSDPLPGFVVFAAGKYGIVIDNTGRVVWYRRFPEGPGLNFMAQPNGRYVARPVTPDPADAEPWLELDALGNLTRALDCGSGLTARFHDMIAAPDGSYWLLCDETRALDLSAIGGVAQAQVTGTGVQHRAADGTMLFRWTPFDHFAITDVDPAERTGRFVNWTHGNALDVDTDGNIIVSFRNLNEITKINAVTGDVMWRLGGRRNQFAFRGTTMPAFSHQHGARVYGSAALVLLDNTGDPDASRAERYALDERTRTAQLVRSYGPGASVVTLIGGSVQDLPQGRTLVSFGTAGRVEEYDAQGRVVWRIEGNAGYVFRAQRISSLYAPGAGLAR
jgi:hypothetical protein